MLLLAIKDEAKVAKVFRKKRILHEINAKPFLHSASSSAYQKKGTRRSQSWQFVMQRNAGLGQIRFGTLFRENPETHDGHENTLRLRCSRIHKSRI